MGLDTSHNCWHGAYSAFSRWRDKLAEVAGYAFYDSTEGGFTHKRVLMDWGHTEDKNFYGEWDKLPEDPLIHLIAHSDCEGKIKHEHCKRIADRLEELLPLLNGEGGGHVGNYRETTMQFISGLRLAQRKEEDVDFH